MLTSQRILVVFAIATLAGCGGVKMIKEPEPKQTTQPLAPLPQDAEGAQGSGTEAAPAPAPGGEN